VRNDEPYCIDPELWKTIGEDMHLTKKRGGIPAHFGYNIRPINDHCHHFKAEEWKNWSLRYSPIYFEGVLPEPYYSEYVSLVHAVIKATSYTIIPDDIKYVHITFPQSSHLYLYN